MGEIAGGSAPSPLLTGGDTATGAAPGGELPSSCLGWWRGRGSFFATDLGCWRSTADGTCSLLGETVEARDDSDPVTETQATAWWVVVGCFGGDDGLSWACSFCHPMYVAPGAPAPVVAGAFFRLFGLGPTAD